MSNYIDPEGRFDFMTPADWVHKNVILEAPEHAPIAFSLDPDPVGNFQLSCKPTSSPVVRRLMKIHNIKECPDIEKEIPFKELFIESNPFDTFTWFGSASEYFFMITFIHDSKTRKNPKVKKEIKKARACIKSIRIIPKNKRQSALAHRRLSKFMTALAASIDLANRAVLAESNLEYIVLLANQIDALLRLAIILNRQIETGTEDIEVGLLYQGEKDKPIMEKQIYKRALDETLIDQSIHSTLSNLYDERNKVVHRYIITDITTKEVMKIAYDYGKIEETISMLVSNLEKKQFEKKVGTYADQNPVENIGAETLTSLLSKLKEKHASSVISQKITLIKDEK